MDALFQENERLRLDATPSIAGLGEFRTLRGELIPGLEIAYQTFGEFNGDNAILVCHALTGTSNVIGWWNNLVGPGKAIDTEKFCVIGNNLFGGCQGSTGPSSLHPDGDSWGARFPIFTVADQVRAQRMLLKEIGIERLHCIVGCSTGGFLALDWSVRFPGFSKKIIVTAASARQNAEQIALNETGRQAIMRDPKWKGGDYPLDDPPKSGLAVARMLGHIAYLSGEALDQKFGRKLQDKTDFAYTLAPEFAIESYLNYQGDKFTERFDANSYLYLTRAANYFDLQSLHGASSDFLFIAFSSDTLYPPSMSEELHEMAIGAGQNSKVVVVDLPYGHDAFLLDGELQGRAIQEFISEN